MLRLFSAVAVEKSSGAPRLWPAAWAWAMAKLRTYDVGSSHNYYTGPMLGVKSPEALTKAG